MKVIFGTPNRVAHRWSNNPKITASTQDRPVAGEFLPCRSVGVGLSSLFYNMEDGMNALHFLGSSRSRSEALMVALLIVGLVASANGQDVTVKTGAAAGHIDFDHPGTAKASVEVDLNREMFGDLFGISDA